MQVLAVIVPYIKSTSKVALACESLRLWLSNNGFPITTSKGTLCLQNYTFYKLLHFPDLDQWTFDALCNAIHVDDCNQLLLLLKSGADIETKGNARNTPLRIAAIFGKIECLKLLLKHQADIDVKDDFGNTALSGAVSHHNSECVKILLKHGAKVDPWMKKQYPRYFCEN